MLHGDVMVIASDMQSGGCVFNVMTLSMLFTHMPLSPSKYWLYCSDTRGWRR